ncbi:MAG: hypothetical protein IT174_10745 [Acidobacteria bacterium]|nr:hypothetical protein [Acidobacteriota bacterium]
MKELWFKRSDGIEFACVEGSETHQLMERDGAFRRVEETTPSPEADDTDPQTGGELVKKPLAKMNKTELLAEAAEIGVTIEDADAVTKAQIIAAIGETNSPKAGE